MDENKISDSLIMEIVNDAFPGRSHEQVVPFALIFSGVMWGRDFRYGAVPEDENGAPVLGCRSEETYRPYLSWLADYLYTLEAEPSKEQKGLCKYVSRMVPEDVVLMIGMNAAMYVWDIDAIETWVESGEPFSAYSQEMKDLALDGDWEYDEDTDRELYEVVRLELDEKKRNCPDVRHADVGYRVPLSIALKKIPNKKGRIDLLNQFYQAYENYIMK